LGQSNDVGAGLTSLTSSNAFATLEMTSGRRPRGDRGAGEDNTSTLVVKYA
jgi:hypothetical protein